MADKESLLALTNKQLQEKLKEKNLPVSGKKEELVARLLANLQASASEPAAESSEAAQAVVPAAEPAVEAPPTEEALAATAELTPAAPEPSLAAATPVPAPVAAPALAPSVPAAAAAPASAPVAPAAPAAPPAAQASPVASAPQAPAALVAPVAPATSAPVVEEELIEETNAEELNLSPAEKKKREREAEERRRKYEKQKKLKEKKKVIKAEEQKELLKQGLSGKGKGGKGKGNALPNKAAPIDDDIEVDYVVPEVLEGTGMTEDSDFAGVLSRFKYVEPEKKVEEEDEEEKAPKKRTKPKASLLEEAEDSDEEAGEKALKKKRKVTLMSVAELKTLVKRPDVVEVWDTTSADPRLLVYLKAYRNTCGVPKHWSSKRKYMAGKRGVEKPPFKLPDFIEATGIAKIRQSILEKQAEQTFKQKSRNRVHPKMGKLDIDYQVLHDAFFKFATKPKLTKHNEMYHEGKEYEAKMMNKRPGQLSAALKEALGMSDGAPPPWLINMQRYGPPPAYPNLKIPGLNAPIPQGAEYGYHAGGWGKPPVDEFGNPLYGDWKQDQATSASPEDNTLWGEVEDYEEEEDEDEPEAGDRGDGAATPMLGTATPLVGTGSSTPHISGGMQSISGVSSITSGMDTPGTGGKRSTRGGIASVSGISSASLTPTPQLFQVLEEQKARSSKGGVYPSSHTYKMRGSHGSSIHGVGSSGTGTPLGGIGTPIGGIGTPIGGIGTPHGISTPHGIGTPGMGTRTPHGISTPVGIGSAGIGTPIGGIGTPGMGTPMGGIGTPMGIGGIATPIGGIATPVGGIATPIGGIATPIGGIATPIGGIATPIGGVATHGHGGGRDTPGPVTMSLNPDAVENEGILTADIIRQQLKQHEEAASKAKIAAGQKEVEARKGPVKGPAKKRKDKTKFKF